MGQQQQQQQVAKLMSAMHVDHQLQPNIVGGWRESRYITELYVLALPTLLIPLPNKSKYNCSV
jgi:hypothetical protein